MRTSFGVAVTVCDGDFVASVRDLPEVVTAGASLTEALTLAADAIEVSVAGRMEDDMPLPEPSRLRSGEHAVEVPARLAAKAAVYRAFKASGLRKTELARRMNRNEVEVRRILNPRHGTKLDQLEEAARALGGHLTIAFEAR